MEVYCIVNETKLIEAPTRKIDLSEPLAYNNAFAHAFRVTIHNDDENEADLTGISVTGTFLKANDEAVDPIVGSIINGEGGNPCVAQVVLPPSCYVTPGRFKFTMNFTKSGGIARTIQWVEGRVEKNTSGTIIDPGSPVTNYSTIIANANAAAEAATTAAANCPEITDDTTGLLITYPSEGG